MPAPPTWLTAWRRMVILLWTIPIKIVRHWSQMLRLEIPGTRSLFRVLYERSPCWTATEQTEDQAFRNQVRAEPINPRVCQHRQVRRYGNARGRFALCETCGTKWKWSIEVDGWVHWPGSQQSQQRPLPPPSAATIRDVNFVLGAETSTIDRPRGATPKQAARQQPPARTRTTTTSTTTPAPTRIPLPAEADMEESLASRSSRATDRRRISRRAPTTSDVDNEVDINTVYSWDEESL